MKYLQLFELNTSTYLSAADKLKDQHPKRAELIRKWAQHRSEIRADRIFIHKFKIDLDPVEEFEITDCRIGTGLWNRRSIEICLSSHITNVILDIRWEPIPDNADDFMGRRDIWVQTEVGVMSLWKCIDNNRGNDTIISHNFLFNNRQDAIQLKKFLMEEYSNNNEMLNVIKKLRINQLYESK